MAVFASVHVPTPFLHPSMRFLSWFIDVCRFRKMRQQSAAINGTRPPTPCAPGKELQGSFRSFPLQWAGSSIWMKYVGDNASSVCTHPEILVFSLKGTNRVDVVCKGPIRTKRLSREAKEDQGQGNAAAIALKSNEIIREKRVKTTTPASAPPDQRAL